jgi:hypothetical protein
VDQADTLHRWDPHDFYSLCLGQAIFRSIPNHRPVNPQFEVVVGCHPAEDYQNLAALSLLRNHNMPVALVVALEPSWAM